MPTIADLEAIHRTHSYGWTFESLDVFLTGNNGLNRDALQAKLGKRTRGGWCFELNEWLALALEEAGFRVRRLMARNTFVPDRPRTHQMTIVEVGSQTWTADAGFGAQTPREPMLLEDGFERVQDGLPYRVEFRPAAGTKLIDEPSAWVVRTRVDGGWRDLYQFTLESATPADFAVANHFHLTNPASSFADTRICTRPVAGGRLTLADHVLKTWKTTPDGEVLEHQERLASRAAYAAVLETRFGLELPGAAVDRLWALEPSVSRGSAPLTEKEDIQ